MIRTRCLSLAASALLFARGANSLSAPRREIDRSRRECLRSFGKALVAAPFAASPAFGAVGADDQQGIAAVTDSRIGRAVRRSVVQSARVADRLDERWERLSDSLRDRSRCDENTGRRLYDNGKRRDGTSIGNPGLGELCAPEPLSLLDVGMKDRILDAAVRSASSIASGEKGGAKTDALYKEIQETKDLVRPSFDRSMQNLANDDERNRASLKFELYSTLRAITNFLKGDKSAIRAFQLAWGNQLVSAYAPSADRNDYVSPFPGKEDELQDFDYDRGSLLDALGKLTATLDRLKSGGLLGFYEISIPYDDYGSVVTVALDDCASIGAEILLSEQGLLSEGPVHAVARALFDKARINCRVDTFYIDPSTTRQVDYNPTQLLLSFNGLSKI